MRAQTEAAVRSADVSLFVVDARAGLTPLDRHFAEFLRTLGKPIVLVANKAESNAAAAGVVETYALGFGDPVAISAEHGEGLGDLYDAIFAFVGEERTPTSRATANWPERRRRPRRSRSALRSWAARTPANRR